MNVHDSERLTGLLEEAGYVAAPGGEHADVVVFNTCAVRENADNKLYGNLGHLASVKAKRPGMQIAVGGCLAQKDQGRVLERAPWVIRRALGHFGAYREGVGKIVGRLRGTFDPGQCLNVALEGADNA